MNLLTTLYDLNQMKNLSAYVDGFLIGNEQFGTRLTKSFSVENIKVAIKNAKFLKKDIFLMCNQMFTDDQLDGFKSFLSALNLNHVDGIVVADLGAVLTIKNLGYASKVIYNPETLLTNTYDVNFLANEGIYGAYIAKEITLDDIKMIAEAKQLKLFMVGHGHLNMFYSKRQLIDNFMHFTEEDNIYHNQQNLKIIEENRKEDPYPILEDQAGTHVFRSQVFASINHLEELSQYVDYLVIDSIFKDDMYALTIAALYQSQMVDETLILDLKKAYDEVWDEGFLYKKTIYKSKG
ncbi:MAG: U32 family peptidase [Acholeplasmataceae bacterium]|jgi:putative protease|nr:U32 family peptidase [Acholeplasmataceae bacterium]